MSGRLSEIVVRYPWMFILLFVGISVFFGFQLPKAEVDPDVKNQLPADYPARLDIDTLEDMFGGSEMVMLVITADDVLAADTLKRVKQISKKIDRLKLVDRTLSLFELKDIRGEGGEMLVDPAVKRIPKTDQAREKLRAQIMDNDLVYGNVVSTDWKATAVIGLLKDGTSDTEVIGLTRQIIADTPGAEPVYIAGMPYVRVNLNKDIKGDLRKFLPVGLLIMLVFLFVAFRQLRGVLLPFLMTIMAVVVAMGLIPLFGWKIQMVTVILPVILIAVANDYGIHLIARYQEENVPGNTLTKQDLAKRVVDALGKPVLAAGITTIVGLMCLLTHIITPAQELGILSSLGVAFALSGSIMFIPAILAVLPKAKPLKNMSHAGIESGGTKVSLLERFLKKTSRAVVAHPKKIIVGTLVSVALVSTGIWQVVIDTNPVNYYPLDSPVSKASLLADKYFGGSTTLNITAKGDMKDPVVLKQIDALEQHLLSLPNVDQTSSLPKVIRRMNKVMNDNNKAFDTIPEQRRTVAEYLLLYSMSGDPDDFDRMVDFNYENAQLTARINKISTQEIAQVVAETERYIQENGGPFQLITGFAAFFSDMIDEIVKGQMISLLLSIVLIALTVMILFRSVVAGLMASIPLGLAMPLLFGIMGYFHVELNIATAMLSSIMIGVGVDYTIHYLWRYRDERRAGQEPVAAVTTTLMTTGRGIIFNALSVVIGFAVLMASSFLPIRFFGILVVISVGACLFGALVLLPAICLVFRPKYLEPLENVVEKG